MKCFDKFKRKMTLSGGSIRNENIISSQNLLNEVFADDASNTLNIYFWQLGLTSYENEKKLNIRLYERKYSAANGYTVKFHTLNDTPVIVGDIIYMQDFDEYYICTESFDIDRIHYQGKLTLCNWILKWQNKYGDILEYPCYDINSTQYNSGEQSNKQFTIGSSQHMILLPCDENTVALNSPQRFFLDKNKVNPTSFIVTQNDTTSYNIGKKGIVRVTLYEYANLNETDRPDLGICDYIDKSTLNNSDTENLSMATISYDTTIIKSGGNKQTFTAKFYDNDGVEINITPKWEIVCDFKEFLEKEISGNSIKIGIDNDDLIDEEFKLILKDESDQYSSSVIVRIESLL